MRIRVQGGTPLNGTFIASSNPNAAKALVAASMLTDQPTILHNVPQNTSTRNMLDAAASLGAQLTWSDQHTLTVQTEAMTRRVINQEMVSGAPGILLFLAPLLVRRQHVRLEVDFPLNRIRTHLDAMRDVGLDVVVKNNAVEIKAVPWEYKDLILNSPSVTATAIIMMLAATLGKETIIHNAACEPHIVDLGHALQQMGADINGLGSNIITILGTSTLTGFETTISLDHIEIASVAAIAALSGGRINISGQPNTRIPDLRIITRTFAYFGMLMDVDQQQVFVPKHERFAVTSREEDIDASVETAPYPGFPSDLVTIAAVIATQAHGTALIHEKLFRDRLLFVDTLKDMGANIILADPHRAIVVGPTRLRGTYIPTPDPRFGLGMLGAALVAEGESVIDNAEGFDYTFDGILARLRKLEAIIQFENET